MLYAVIMAGGAGTRFWPASRTARPKQLLDLVGGRTMIQATVDRLGELVPAERILVVTNQQLVAPIAEQLSQLPMANILGEPCKRDTAPCVGLAAGILARQDSQATMIVLPADHVITTDAQFQNAIRQAATLVDERPGRIVTFGIRPTYAAEGFGYIERGDALPPTGSAVEASTAAAAFQVKKFREKPKGALAQEYFESGRFYWNSGIFVWRAATILTALQTHEPGMSRHLQVIAQAFGTPHFAATFEREFTALQGKSIDYAVMEHHPDVAVIEAPFRWDDVGSWQALARSLPADEHGNTVLGRHLGVRSTGCIVRSDEHHLIATLGLRDTIVVHTPDATLVANKHDEEAVRQVVALLIERGWTEYL